MSNPPLEGSVELVPIDFWTNFQGIDPTSPGPLVSRNHARRAEAVKVDSNGVLTTVEALTTDGTLAAAGAGMTVFGHARDTVNHVELIMGTSVGFQWKLFDQSGFSAWTAYGGAALTVTASGDRFSFLRWNNLILAMNPDASTGLQALNPAAHTYAAVAGAPAAFHLTGFTNRVIATRVTGNIGRIQWSVKNDYTNWAGLGSGFEDLLAATGSRSDRPWSVWPISETQAIVVCERSLFMMTATDNFDAPFRFTLIVGGEGTPHPYTVAAVPGGIIYAGWTDVWYVTSESITSLGKPFLNELLFGQDFGSTDHISTLGESHSGVYVAITNEYWLKTVTTGYRCQLASRVWTQQTMNAGQMTYVEGVKLLNPSGEVRDWAVYFADLGNVVDVVFGSVNSSTPDLITGDIEADLPEHRIDVAYVTVSYSTRDTVARTIEIQVSRDDGDWEAFGSFATKPYVSSVVTTSPINRTHVATIQKSTTANKIAFRVKPTAAVTTLKILRLSAYCAKSGWTPTTP